jgi:NAD(P)-dependent dehydrogenase (short-subunit alcohol dehydrogenase family)
MSTKRLDGKRVLLVGGSTGLGRAVGISLAAEGAHVAFAARRHDKVQAAAEIAGNGAVGLACDVTDAASCQAVVDDAVERLGGLDALVYTVAYDVLVRMRDADETDWANAFATNVTGASLLTRAAIPHLEASRGKVVYFSSMSGPYGEPWQGLGVYGATKAALERLADSWQAEHRSVSFTRLVVGVAIADADAPSQFGSAWDVDLATELMPTWTKMSTTGDMVSTADLCQTMVTILAVNAALPVVAILPRD